MPFLDINFSSQTDMLKACDELELHGHNFDENESCFEGEYSLYMYVDSEKEADELIDELESFLSMVVTFDYSETEY